MYVYCAVTGHVMSYIFIIKLLYYYITCEYRWFGEFRTISLLTMGGSRCWKGYRCYGRNLSVQIYPHYENEKFSLVGVGFKFFLNQNLLFHNIVRRSLSFIYFFIFVNSPKSLKIVDETVNTLVVLVFQLLNIFFVKFGEAIYN